MADVFDELDIKPPPGVEPPGATVGAPPSPRMTPVQMQVFDELLAVGGSRPTQPYGLAEQLREALEETTAAALSRWTERSLWVGKSPLEAVHRCEGQFVADRKRGFDTSTLHPATAVGQVTHRAIQIAHTHPGRMIADYVSFALDGARSDEVFANWWNTCGEAAQSDLISTATSKLAGWLDSFPPLNPAWSPRFEESLQVKIGRVTLSARPDLVLGRPRGDGKQTMFIADFKSGGLGDHHLDEAQFYALVATLRHRVAPFRSTVFSLAGGDWTDPDVHADSLWAAAQRLSDGVERMVDTLGGHRAPTLSPGRHCSWCPEAPTCEARAAWDTAGNPEEFTWGDPVPVSVPLRRRDSHDEGATQTVPVSDIPSTHPRTSTVAAVPSSGPGPVSGATAGDAGASEQLWDPFAPVPEPAQTASVDADDPYALD